MRNFIRQCVVAYTVSQNTHHSVVTVISSNLKPIFKILSLLENLLNFQQNSMTAHYLEKLALELPHCRRRRSVCKRGFQRRKRFDNKCVSVDGT